MAVPRSSSTSRPARTATKPVATKPVATKPVATKPVATPRPRVFAMSFASVYPLYLQKVEKKGRTQAELDQAITWLTGYGPAELRRVIAARLDLEAFFAGAPRLSPQVGQITGVVCGVRVEDVADPLMQKIRWLDKLVDELARGWPLARVLRQ